MKFINTRPTDLNQPTTELFGRAGVSVAELPLIQIKPLEAFDWSAQAKAADLIVCVSPRAARFSLQHLSSTALSQVKTKPWVCVGAQTARALAEFGVSAKQPHVSSSEGLLAMAEFTALPKGAVVLIVRGQGGRRLLDTELESLQIRVQSAVVYQRVVLPELKQLWAERIGSQSCAVLITSLESWQSWLNVEPHPERHRYLVLGQRLFSSLSAFKPVQLESLAPQTVLDTFLANFGES